MSTDLIAKSRDIIELNNSINLSYTPIYGVLNQKVYTQNMANITNLRDDIEKLDDQFAKLMHPHDTELSHFKAIRKEFKFNLALHLAAFRTSTMQETNILGGLDKAVRKAFQIFDKKMLTGDALDNTGMLNNENTVTNASAAITDVNSLTSLVAKLKNDVAVATESDANNVLFWFVGSALRQFTEGTVTGDTQAIDRVRTVANNNLGFVHPIIDNSPKIIAFIPDATVLHRGIIPQVFNQGERPLDYEREVHIAYSTCAVEVLEEGGVVVQPVTLS